MTPRRRVLVSALALVVCVGSAGSRSGRAAAEALPASLSGYDDEARVLAARWLSAKIGAFGGRQLREILRFSREQHAAALQQAASAKAADADTNPDVRVLWAAMQFARAADPTARLLARIHAACNAVIRARPIGDDTGAKATDARQRRDEYLRRLGDSLI